jgi:hypothetical protein
MVVLNLTEERCRRKDGVEMTTQHLNAIPLCPSVVPPQKTLNVPWPCNLIKLLFVLRKLKLKYPVKNYNTKFLFMSTGVNGVQPPLSVSHFWVAEVVRGFWLNRSVDQG